MEQPLAESSTREGKRTAASRPYGTPQVDLRLASQERSPERASSRVGIQIEGVAMSNICQKYVKRELEGDVPQDEMTEFIFSGSIRKLSDLNTVTGNNTKVYLIRWHLVARMSSIEPELGPQTG